MSLEVLAGVALASPRQTIWTERAIGSVIWSVWVRKVALTWQELPAWLKSQTQSRSNVVGPASF